MAYSTLPGAGRTFGGDLAITNRQLSAAPMGNAGQVSPFTKNPYMVVNYGKDKNTPSYDNTQNLDPSKIYQLVDKKTGQVITSDPNDPTSLARLVLKANQLSGYEPTRASWDIQEGTQGADGSLSWGPSIATDRENRSFLNKALPYAALALGALGTGGALGLFGAGAAGAGAGAGLAGGLSGIGAGISAAGTGLSALGAGALGAGTIGAGLSGIGSGVAAGSSGLGALGAAGSAATGLGGVASGIGSAAGGLAPEITVMAPSLGGLGAGVGSAAPNIGSIAAGLGGVGAGVSSAAGQPAEKSWQEKASQYLEYGGYGAQLLGSIFGGGGGSGNTGTMPNTALNPIFNAQLPAANLPGGNNLAPRQMPAQDWNRYAFAPEQSFFQNVPQGYAHGGEVRPGRGSSPLTEGLGTGRSDDIPAVLSDGEYVMDAETVAMLGDGSNKAGADRLDQLRVNLRKHKAKKLSKGKMSANAKHPEKYLAGVHN